ncbi:MAG: glycosyltransferase, partial [Planctomycetota bacterium]|nr:glycosyltransferase [Planctomycetota bacterium]
MKIAHVVPRVNSRSSGVAEAVLGLCAELQKIGQDTRLLCLEPKPCVERFQPTDYYVCSKMPFGKRLGISPKLRNGIKAFATDGDVLHSHSIWMMPNVYPGNVVKRAKCKLIMSPHGTLTDWALERSPIKKFIMWRYQQKKVLESAHCLHATSSAERDDLRRLGFKNPIAVIPNGIEVTGRPCEKKTGSRLKTLLVLSRIHPKKGVDMLLESWRQISPFHEDWQLRIVGPTESSFAKKMMATAQSQSLPRVEFVGEKNGPDKINELLNADLYVLPTFSENFGISVAEALAHGLPAIVTKGAPWSGLETHSAGFWVEVSTASITQGLRTAMGLSVEERNKMGERGGRWVTEEFALSNVGKMMNVVYEWLVGL